MAFKINLTGQVYNRWTVIGFSHTTTPNGLSYWNCVCACGTKRKVQGGSLTTNSTVHGSKSCGCIQSPPKGLVVIDKPKYEYVPVCKGRIDSMLKSEPDYFKRDSHTSLFETFIHLPNQDRSNYRPKSSDINMLFDAIEEEETNEEEEKSLSG